MMAASPEVTLYGMVFRGGAGVQPEQTTLRVLMVAGGTGGHIFPALAVAEELRQRARRRAPEGTDCVIEFLGTGRALESRLIPAAGFSLRTVSAAGLKGIGGWRKLHNLMVLPRSAIETALVLREFQPDVVVGMGGYLAGPAMLEAALRDIPTLLIEPNVIRSGFTPAPPMKTMPDRSRPLTRPPATLSPGKGLGVRRRNLGGARTPPLQFTRRHAHFSNQPLV